jgi:hypothetical protein
MTKHLDSPLKITGILLTLTGVFLSLFTTHPSLPEGYSIAILGIIMILTAWVITNSSMNQKERNFIEVLLVIIIIVFSGMMAMDYFGLISINGFLTVSGQHLI